MFFSYAIFLSFDSSLCQCRPAVTELQNAASVERVTKEKSVCFFLVTSSENPQLSEKLKVINTKMCLFLIIFIYRIKNNYFWQIRAKGKFDGKYCKLSVMCDI